MTNTSALALPVHLTHQALAEAVATATPEVLFSEGDLMGRGISATVTRVGRPTIAVADRDHAAPNTVALDLGLAASAILEKNTRIFGNSSARGTLQLELTIVASVSGTRLNTYTELTAYRWLEEPQVAFGGLDLGVGALSIRILTLLANRIGRRIDAQIRDRQPLLSALEAARTALEQPRILDSGLDISLLTRVGQLGIGELSRRSRGLSVVVDAALSLTIASCESGAAPHGEDADAAQPVDPRKLIDSGGFSLRPNFVLDYRTLGRAASDALVGRRFERLGRSVEVSAVAIRPAHPSGGSSPRLSVELRFDGSLAGRGSISGDLNLLEGGRAVGFEDPEVRILEGGLLVRGLLSLAAKRVSAELTRRVAEESRRGIAEAEQQLRQRLSDGEPMPGVVVVGQLDALRIERLEVGPEAVLAEAVLVGTAAVRIDRLPAKPPATGS